jgi:hypothetical protein
MRQSLIHVYLQVLFGGNEITRASSSEVAVLKLGGLGCKKSGKRAFEFCQERVADEVRSFLG